jgi:aspartate-semialdehyde dehydrogenase
VALFHHKEVEPHVFPHQIAFNTIPAIGDFRNDGYTEEEWKLVVETRKILGLPDLRVSPTAVRVPVFSCHSESVHCEFRAKVTVKEARACLTRAEGVTLVDRPEENAYPMGFALAGSDPVHVGRIRQDPSDERCVNLWIVADNLRKGAALNAVQILEALAELEDDDA